MYVVVGAQHLSRPCRDASPLLGTLANSAAYFRVHLGRRKSHQVNSSYLQLKTDNFLSSAASTRRRPRTRRRSHRQASSPVRRLSRRKNSRPLRRPPPHQPVLPLASSCKALRRSCPASARRFPLPLAVAPRRLR